MPILKSALKKEGKNGVFYVCVVEGQADEVLAFDGKILEYEGKDLPFPIAGGEGGKKKYVQFPKAGGFQGKGGGFSRGKSDKELYLQALTMTTSYAKDECTAFIATGAIQTPDEAIEFTEKAYKRFSKMILADLKAIEGEAPKQEAQKTAEKPPVSPPPATSAEKPKYVPPAEDAKLTVKQKLEKKAWAYLQNLHSDSDANFKTLLMELTAFVGKDGKEVSCDSLDKLSEKWAGSAIGKLEKMIEEEERKAMAESLDMSDVRY